MVVYFQFFKNNILDTHCLIFYYYLSSYFELIYPMNNNLVTMNFDRFYRSSLGLQIIITFILITILIKEAIKFCKQIYVNCEEYNQRKKQQISQVQIENRQVVPNEHHEPQPFVKYVIKLENIYFKIMIFLSIVVINIVMVSSFEYIISTACIYIVFVVIMGLIEIQNQTIIVISEIISIALVFGWFINLYTFERSTLFNFQ